MDPGFAVRLLWLRWRLVRRDRWTRAHLEAHQARALAALRKHAYIRSPFYRRFHAGLQSRPLDELPVLTKAVLMEHFDELVTDRRVRRADVEAHVRDVRGDERYLGRYRVNTTSGSTGQPGLFLYDRDEWTAILASFARGPVWAGYPTGLTHRIGVAVVASTVPTHMSARVGATLRSPWVRPLRLDAADPLDGIVARLNAFRPAILVTYASMAGALADEQRAGRLRIAPGVVFTSSEVLTAETRRRIEAVWGKRLFDQYGATEGGSLGAECGRHAGIHLFEDQVIFEIVDGDNRPVPPGVFGEKVLVTVLFSRTQPLIRYELSDSLRLAAVPCACGRPFRLVDAIQGRAEDVLRFPAAIGGRVAVHPNVFHRVMDTIPVGGWRIVQEPNRLRVLVAGPRDDFGAAWLVDALGRALVAQGAVLPPILVEEVAAIPRTPGGKAPLITVAPAAT